MSVEDNFHGDTLGAHLHWSQALNTQRTIRQWVQGVVLATAVTWVLPSLSAAEGTANPEVAPADDVGARAFIKETPGGGGRPRFEPATSGDDHGGDQVVVPEPGTLALLGLGLASLGVMRRRNRKA
jgi:hypothetical protein